MRGRRPRERAAGVWVELKVLGRLRVSRSGQPVALGAARKPRVMLAVLLAKAGEPVSVDALVTGVWGDHPPASARRNLQSYAHRLRRELGAERIVTQAAGYAVVTGDSLDSSEFRRLAAAGGTALDAGDAVTAGASLRAALDLWSGPAFAEFLDCEPVAEEAARLEQLRLDTYERWAEATLVTGPTPRLATELAELCRLHPYREGLRAHLMQALYRTGRQAEALEVFRQTRALLVEELGVEPDPLLQRLHQAMLRGDAELLPVPGGDGPLPRAPAEVAVPRELPAGAPDFAGRARALAFLDGSLPGDGGARTVVICGMGGVGKTALAVHWAHRAGDHFPDGQLFADLRGFAAEPPLRPVEALGLLLRALGVPAADVPVELDAAAGLYRTLLADRRVLVVLDNARDAEQVRPLLPAGPGCLALVTSRDRLSGLVAREGARRLTLDVLTSPDAAALLRGLLGEAAPGPRALADLAGACGHLPLALRVAAAHLAEAPAMDVAGYLGALRGDRGLSALEIDGDPQASVRAAFTLSHRALEPAAQRLFRLLGLVPGADVTVPAATALAGTDAAEAERLLGTLARAHLAGTRAPGRYALHDLLLLYAREQAEAASDQERAGALERLDSFYLGTMDAAARRLYPEAVRLPVDVPGPEANEPGDEAAAVRWVDAELPNLVARIEQAATSGPRRTAWLLADALSGYFWLRRRDGTQWLATAAAGLAAAEASRDQQAMAAAHLNLALANHCLVRFDSTIDHAGRALALSRRAGWRAGEAAALGHLGVAHTELGDQRRALAHFDDVVTLHREAGNPGGEAGALTSLSAQRFQLGALHAAVGDGLAALARHRDAPSPAGQARAHNVVALSYLYLGEFDAALDHVTQAIELYGSVGERYGYALAKCVLSKLHFDAGRHAAALDEAAATLRAAATTGDLRIAGLALVDLAEIRRHLGDSEHAVHACSLAVHILRQTRRHHAATTALIGLAEAHLHDGHPDRALTSATTAQRIATQYGYQLLQGFAATVIAEAHHAAGNPAEAATHARAALASHLQTGYRLGASRTRALLTELSPGRDTALSGLPG